MSNPTKTDLSSIPLVLRADLYQDKTLVAGQGALAAGSVLGEVRQLAASKANGGAGAAGANTGNGTLTLDATAPIVGKPKAGAYALKIVTKAVASPAAAAVAELRDPEGNLVQRFDVPTTPGVTIQNALKFVILDGSTAFEVGDGFVLTIAESASKLKLCNKANIDGSEVASYVLTKAVDATSEVTGVPVLKAGKVFASALVFGGASVAVDHIAQLADSGLEAVTADAILANFDN